MPLTLRYMQTSDIRQVMAIDSLSFDPPWPANSYTFEINQSTVSHMVVLEYAHDRDNNTSSNHGCWKFLNQIVNRKAVTNSRTIVGYGGLWKIADEAHISTIAIHPDYRGKSYGEILLAGMFYKSLMLEAGYMVLEVRVSNIVAQTLYRKYNFTNFDIKENYYRSNKEDAYDMRVMFDDSVISNFHNLYQQLQAKQHFVDQYSQCSHPRRG